MPATVMFQNENNMPSPEMGVDASVADWKQQVQVQAQAHQHQFSLPPLQYSLSQSHCNPNSVAGGCIFHDHHPHQQIVTASVRSDQQLVTCGHHHQAQIEQQQQQQRPLGHNRIVDQSPTAADHRQLVNDIYTNDQLLNNGYLVGTSTIPVPTRSRNSTESGGKSRGGSSSGGGTMNNSNNNNNHASRRVSSSDSMDENNFNNNLKLMKHERGGSSSSIWDAPVLTETELERISVRELNKLLQGQQREIVSRLKAKRRTLKNRGYALKCRSRRQQTLDRLQAENKMLTEELNRTRQQLFECFKAKDELCHEVQMLRTARMEAMAPTPVGCEDQAESLAIFYDIQAGHQHHHHHQHHGLMLPSGGGYHQSVAAATGLSPAVLPTLCIPVEHAASVAAAVSAAETLISSAVSSSTAAAVCKNEQQQNSWNGFSNNSDPPN